MPCAPCPPVAARCATPRLPSLVNDLIAQPGPIVLVLDDYHVITDRFVHETVTLLVERMPEHVHVVVATRGNPPLPLGRLRAAGELQELRTDDLAFDTAEVTRVLTAVPGVDLGADDVDRLARRTEGWPAGVALAAASLAGRDGDVGAFVDAFTGTDRYVLDYLGTEVLAALPADLRDFVLRTSILRRLSPESCQAVTGRPDAAALLDRAERAGVFLSAIDPGRQWFRYHRLFGELLRHELVLAEPTVVPTLHRRAAAWSTEVGAIGDAVAHHVAAGDMHEAAELVAGCWNEWFNAGRLGSVAAWLDLLPDPLVRADPRLCVARAWLLLDLGRLDEVDRWIAAGDAVGAAETSLRSATWPCCGPPTGSRSVTSAPPGRRPAGSSSWTTARCRFAATVAYLQLGITAFWCGDVTAVTPPAGRGRPHGPPVRQRPRRDLRARLPGARPPPSRATWSTPPAACRWPSSGAPIPASRNTSWRRCRTSLAPRCSPPRAGRTARPTRRPGR